MESWLFHIFDSAKDCVFVIGTGATAEDAETDALAKWDTAMNGRADYNDRLPAVACCTDTSTDSIDGLPPRLIL